MHLFDDVCNFLSKRRDTSGEQLGKINPGDSCMGGLLSQPEWNRREMSLVPKADKTRRRRSWRETEINPTDFGRAEQHKRGCAQVGGGGMPEATHSEASSANFEWPNIQVRAAKSIHRVCVRDQR